jgi:isocitrate dehydrogenase
MGAAIQRKEVTYDLARLMDDANKLSCSGFGDALIAQMA